MRILRGRSNLEVSSKGFALFVLGLILATFFGGGLRTLLSSEQVHRRIVSELKNRFPKHEFQIGSTEVLLSRGIWPGLGLQVRELIFKQEVCGKLSFVLTLPQAVLPLDIMSLWRGKIRMDHVQISEGRMHVDYHDCPAVKTTAEPSAPSTVSTPPVRPVPLPNLEWQRGVDVMNGIELKTFTITYEKNPTWKLVLNSVYVTIGNELSARALLDLEKSLPFGALNHPVEIDVHGEGKALDWNVQTDFKEGHIHLTGNVDMESQAARVKLEIRQVPIKDLVGEIYQMGLIDQELKLKATWLSCVTAWEGLLKNYAATPLVAQGCQIEGGYGHAELDRAEFWLSGEYLKMPAHIKVDQLALQPVAEAFNRQVLPAVFSRLGVWSGAVDFNSPARWRADGHLENAEFVISNQSLHGKQNIDRVRTRATRAHGQIQGRVDEMKLRDGEFLGAVEFDLGEDGRGGRFEAKIEKLSFSPAIQNLLVGGSLGPLVGSGQGSLSGGELTQWLGNFAIAEISGAGWRAESLQMTSSFNSGIFHIDGKIKNATTESRWRLFSQLLSVNPQLPPAVAWRNLGFKVDVHKTGGTVQSLTATEVGSGRTWKSRGTWLRDGDFSGVLDLGTGKKADAFALRGEKGNMVVHQSH